MLPLAATLLLLPPQTTPPSPGAAATAVRRLLNAQSAQSRFTRLHLEHNQVFDKHDKPLPPHDKLYEDTWINDLPYKHLLEIDGVPLTGQALAGEQARYDQAIAAHRGLDLSARASQTGGRLYTTGLGLANLLTPLYTFTPLRTDTCAGAPCTVYSALPADTGAHPIRFELWVTERPEPFLFRLTYELTADQHPLRKGSTGRMEFQLFNGVPVETATSYTGYAGSGHHVLHIQTDNTFSRYRRFTTSVTIREATGGQPVQQIPDPPN